MAKKSRRFVCLWLNRSREANRVKTLRLRQGAPSAQRRSTGAAEDEEKKIIIKKKKREKKTGPSGGASGGARSPVGEGAGRGSRLRRGRVRCVFFT